MMEAQPADNASAVTRFMTLIRRCGTVPECFLALGMTAVLLTLPAVALSQTPASLEQRVAKMERMLDSGTLLRLLQSVEELKAEVRELRGQLEQQQYSLSQMTDRQRELYLDVDRRLQRMEAGGAGVAAAAASTGPGPAPPVGTSASAGSTVGGTSAASTSGAAAVGVAAAGAATPAGTPQSTDPLKEQQAYQAAFNLLKAGRYDQAAKSFRKFLAEYPTGKFADNAQYWLGESYYVTRNFDSALREFNTLVSSHPDSQKVTHALLKIGYIHDELGQKEKAREILTSLTNDYPQSTAAGLATKRLERMRQ
ncbi:MAG: tol-pal system protein YbgF [Gammaproteobacteria bacterium]|nr:MAG: tol-pal system protein YbgF [Gammaproteobacteria bacterium]